MTRKWEISGAAFKRIEDRVRATFEDGDYTPGNAVQVVKDAMAPENFANERIMFATIVTEWIRNGDNGLRYVGASCFDMINRELDEMRSAARDVAGAFQRMGIIPQKEDQS